MVTHVTFYSRNSELIAGKLKFVSLQPRSACCTETCPIVFAQILGLETFCSQV